MRLSDLKGKVVFLNFWRTSCGPCIAEMPGIERLYDSLRGENIFFLKMGKERFGELMGMETFVRVQDTTGAPVPENDLFAGLR